MQGLLIQTHLFGLLMFVSFCVHGGASTYANETALRALLQSGYDTYAQPSRPVTIDMNYNIRFMSELDITGQFMSHLGWFELYWTDSRLTWDPTLYDNITMLDVDWVWRPVFAINGIDEIKKIGYINDDVRIIVNYQGYAKYIHDEVLNTACAVNIKSFPYDEQTCDIDVTFKEMDYGKSIILNVDPEIHKYAYVENGEWEYVSSSISTAEFPYTFPFEQTLALVSMSVTFKRLKVFYVINLILPAILLSVGMIWAFIIPTECGERLGFSLTILLSYTVVLTITADMLPTTSQEVPYIATYLLVILVFCTMIVCNVGLNVKLYFMEEAPSKCSQWIYKRLRPIVFFEFKSSRKTKVENVSIDTTISIEDFDHTKKQLPGNDVDTGSQKCDARQTSSEREITNKDVSILYDRLCLYLYSTAVFVTTVWLLLVLTNG